MSDDLTFDLLNKLPLGVLVYHLDDPDDPGSLRLIKANKAASVAVGFDVRPDLNKTIREASPQALETDLPAIYAEVAMANEEHDLGVIEYGDDRVDRGIFRVCAFPLMGRHVGIVFEEMTQRQSAESRLRLLTNAVENARDSIVITDAELDEPGPKIVYANEAFTDLTGYNLDEVLDKTPRILQGPDTDRAVIDRLRENLERGETFSGETVNYRKDGTPFIMDWDIAPIADEEGDITHWVATQRDVTERRRAASNLVERTDDLAAFTEDLKLLHRITTARHETADEAFQEYLRAGCAIFELPIGILSETPIGDPETGERIYRLHTVESPVPEVHAGIQMPLGEAFCDAVVERGRTVSYADVCDEGDEVTCKAAHAEHGLHAFIGTPLVVDGELFGTLNFVSPEPRVGGFAPHEHELIEVMAESVVQLLSLQRAEAARAEADARYRSIVHTVEEGLMLVDAKGTVLMSNPAARDMLGLDETMVLERVAGVPRWQILREDGTSFPDDELPEREVFRTGRPVRGVVQGICKPTGETCWYSVNARAADRDSDGNVLSVVLSFNDVTEQRQAEAELRESEAQLQKAQEIAHIGSWRWDIGADEITWSDELFRIFGLTPDAFEPDYESYLNRLHPDSREMISETVRHALENKTSYEVSHRVVHPDGRVRHIHSLGEVILDNDENVVALQGTAQDVTEQREAQREVERLGRQLERILEAAGEGVYGLDLDGRTTFVNRAASEMIGWNPEQLIDRKQHEVLHHHRADGTPYPVEECPIYQTLRDGEERRVSDEVFWRKDGSSFPVEYVTAPMRLEDEVVGAVVVFQNVSDRVAAEQALQRYADDLEERNAELEQFAYVASHDLQEPLRMVSSFLQLLQRRYADQLDDTADEYIEYAVDGAKRMQKLIQDLLAYSRVGTRGKAFKPLNMNEVLRIVQTDLGPALDEASATVEVSDLPTVEADETQMRQLIQNLIANAVKFRDEADPVVRVSAEEVNEGGRRMWRFAVADNGIGIEPHHADRVFQIFQRLHTRDEYEGTGIGLAMCKKIVERHGGRIWFESDPDAAESTTVGTTFYFTLPSSQSTFPTTRADG